MREWFQSLSLREQLMVGAAGFITACVLFFLVVWEPLSKQSQRLHNDIIDARELVVFMQGAAAEAKSLGSTRPVASSNSRSLLSEVDRSSKRSGLGPYIKRIQPEDQTRVRLWIEDARFDSLLSWLHQLQSQQGIVLENGSVDRDAKAGTVKARLSLVRGQ